jgi:hypothetical protein
MDHASTINFLSTEDTQELAPWYLHFLDFADDYSASGPPSPALWAFGVLLNRPVV